MVRLGRFMVRSRVVPTTQFVYQKGLGTSDALLCLSHTLQSEQHRHLFYAFSKYSEKGQRQDGTGGESVSALMLTLLKSLVIPLLEYFCQLWHPYKAKDIQAIEAFTERLHTKSLKYST